MKKFSSEFADYWADISANLVNKDYEARLCEELSQHAEDSAHYKMLQGSTEVKAAREVYQELGPPSNIIKEYNVIMKLRNVAYLYLESIFVAILQALALLITIFILADLFGSTGIVEKFCILMVRYLTPWFLSGYFAVHIFSKIQRFAPDPQMRRRLFFISMVLPLLLVSLFALLYSHAWAVQVFDPTLEFALYVGAVFLAVHFFALYLVDRPQYLLLFKNNFYSEKWEKTKMWLKRGVFGWLLGSMVISNFFSIQLRMLATTPSIIRFLAKTILWPSDFLYNFLTYLTRTLLQAFSVEILGGVEWLLAIMILVLGFVSSVLLVKYGQIKHKMSGELKLPGLAFGVLIIAGVFLLSFRPQPALVWHFPAQDITALATKQLVRPFWRLGQSHGIDSVFINNEADNVQLSSGQSFYKTFPAGLHCANDTRPIDPLQFNLCERLVYYKTVIFEQKFKPFWGDVSLTGAAWNTEGSKLVISFFSLLAQTNYVYEISLPRNQN